MIERRVVVPERIGGGVFFFRLVMFVLVVLVGVLVDLVTKSLVFSFVGMPGSYREFEPEGVYWLVRGVFGFQTSLNAGGLFGMWQGQSFPLAVLACIAFFGISFWVVCVAWRSRFMVFTLGLIVAGILGNLYDRLGFHSLMWGGENIYAVRDWVLVMIGSYHWPNFNIADAFLVCGSILLFFHQPFSFEIGKSGTSKSADTCPPDNKDSVDGADATAGGQKSGEGQG
jgi:signal peptidase II